jgi:hypothetical protein
MVGRSLAIVRPRVISPPTGEILLLEDVVATHLAAGDWGVIEVSGGPLMGKTTAIDYLGRLFGDELSLTDTDERARIQQCVVPKARVMVTTAVAEYGTTRLGKYQLAPWGQDEWIEYLLAAHRDRCGSVISRLRASQQFGALGGNPGLWRLVLEKLALNDSISSATEALRWAVTHLFSTSMAYHALQRFSLVAAAPLPDELDRETRSLAKLSIERDLVRLLALDSIRTILAAEALALDLADGGVSHLRRRLPPALIHEVSLTVQANHSFQGKLIGVLAGSDETLQATAASMLHAAEIGWQPMRLCVAKKRQRATICPSFLISAALTYWEPTGRESICAALGSRRRGCRVRIWKTPTWMVRRSVSRIFPAPDCTARLWLD